MRALVRGWKSAPAIVIAIALASILARSTVFALSEESIPAADLPSPTSTPTLAPGATPQATITSTPAPASTSSTQTQSEEPSDWRQVPNASPSAEASIASSPEATPSEIPQALDIGSVAPSVEVSDAPLASLIDASTGNPARMASLRITEAARVA